LFAPYTHTPILASAQHRVFHSPPFHTPKTFFLDFVIPSGHAVFVLGCVWSDSHFLFFRAATPCPNLLTVFATFSFNGFFHLGERPAAKKVDLLHCPCLEILKVLVTLSQLTRLTLLHFFFSHLFFPFFEQHLLLIGTLLPIDVSESHFHWNPLPLHFPESFISLKLPFKSFPSGMPVLHSCPPERATGDKWFSGTYLPQTQHRTICTLSLILPSSLPPFGLHFTAYWYLSLISLND